MPRARDSESGRFTERYPPERFIDALQSEGGMASTSEVANHVGCSERLAFDRLTDLAGDGRVDSRNVGNARLWLIPGR